MTINCEDFCENSFFCKIATQKRINMNQIKTTTRGISNFFSSKQHFKKKYEKTMCVSFLAS